MSAPSLDHDSSHISSSADNGKRLRMGRRLLTGRSAGGRLCGIGWDLIALIRTSASVN